MSAVAPDHGNTATMLMVVPENGSFSGKKLINLVQPVIIGRLMDGQDANAPNTLKFNSKVVSRNHARLSYRDGKFYIQDTKSSSGTFLNGERLSPQAQESPVRELYDDSVIKLGEDFNLNGVLHQAITMRIRYMQSEEEQAVHPANGVTPAPAGEDVDGYVDLTMDAEVRANVDDEFNTIWNSLVADMHNPLKRLRSGTVTAPSIPKSNENNPPPAPQLHTPQRPSISVAVSPVNTLSPSSSSGSQSSTGFPAPISPNQPQGPHHHLINNGLVQHPSVTKNNDYSVTLSKLQTYTIRESCLEEEPSATADSAIREEDGVECDKLIKSLTWESDEIRNKVLELLSLKDDQLISFYRSLRGFPSSFLNLVTKYVKFTHLKA